MAGWMTTPVMIWGALRTNYHVYSVAFRWSLSLAVAQSAFVRRILFWLVATAGLSAICIDIAGTSVVARDLHWEIVITS